ncbi:unnamed protein product [Brachionus calyciflorus]|uniref:Uncharacterized protein n=1 Tax=Brachionus calyciflorus TaxID=104777 RepID=A0A814J512_9BILA|nr:unnamed protein product [Brachionus calyciflorus]
MYAEREKERQEKQQAIDNRISTISESDIEAEVNKIWASNGLSTKRKRISKLDRENARKHISKRIRQEEENNVHLRYLERHRDFL